jgi:hypothetical protein
MLLAIRLSGNLRVGVGSNNVDFVRFGSKPTPRYPTPSCPVDSNIAPISILGKHFPTGAAQSG